MERKVQLTNLGAVSRWLANQTHSTRLHAQLSFTTRAEEKRRVSQLTSGSLPRRGPTVHGCDGDPRAAHVHSDGGGVRQSLQRSSTNLSNEPDRRSAQNQPTPRDGGAARPTPVHQAAVSGNPVTFTTEAAEQKPRMCCGKELKVICLTVSTRPSVAATAAAPSPWRVPPPHPESHPHLAEPTSLSACASGIQQAGECLGGLDRRTAD
ncbi:hypothetical protein GN956_G19951 [Arapaima gigas]